MANQGIGSPSSGFRSGLQVMAQEGEVVNFLISRRDVHDCQVEAVVRQLHEMTATSKATRRYQDAIVFKFAVHDSDRRQLHQIPEGVRFLWEVCCNWPYFFHFLHKSPDAFRPVILALVTKEVYTEESSSLQTGGDLQQMNDLFSALFEGMSSLHRAHGFPDSLTRSMTSKVIDVLGAAGTFKLGP